MHGYDVVINAWRDIGHAKAGGSELVIDLIGRGLHDRGHNVLLRAGEVDPSAPRDLPTISAGGAYSQYALGPFRRGDLAGADVVIDINNGMPFLSPLWHSAASVCVVHHLHLEQWQMYFPKPMAAVGRRVEALSIEWAYRSGLYATISPSSAEALERLGVPADRIRELRMPVNSGLQNCAGAATSPTPQFVAVGRLAANKRHDRLLAMWDQVRPVTGGELIIVGDGPERDRLEAIAGPGVRFTGRVDDRRCAELLSSSWLLVHTAAHEGWGLVLSEAAWFATPSLAFDVPGVRDALDRHTCGWGVADEQQFVNQWLALAADPGALEAKGREAASAVRATGRVEHLVDDMEDIIDEAVALHRDEHRVDGWTSRRRVEPPVMNPAVASSAIDADSGGSRVTTSIVIPALDEAERLPLLLDGLAQVVGPETEIIVVDDGSRDDTAAVSEHLLRDRPSQVIRHPENRGKGAAIRTGVAAARGERTIFMDADMATDLSALQPMHEALDRAPVAIGIRRSEAATVRNGATHRKVMAVTFNSIVRACTGTEFLDTQCGFKGFHTDVAKLLFHLNRIDGFAFDVEILWLARRFGLEVVEIPVEWNAVDGSKIRFAIDPLRMAWDVAKLRRAHAGDCVVRALRVEHDDIEPQVLGKEVARLVRTSDEVYADADGVTVPLPGSSAHGHRSVAERVAASVDGGVVHQASIPAEWILYDRVCRSTVSSVAAPAFLRQRIALP